MHVDGIPDNHRIRQDIQTGRLVVLVFLIFLRHGTIGMTPRTIQRILKRIANKARINRPVCPHVLRHTFAVAAVQKGASITVSATLLPSV